MLRIGSYGPNYEDLSTEFESTDVTGGLETDDVVEEQYPSPIEGSGSRTTNTGVDVLFAQVSGLDSQSILQKQLLSNTMLLPWKPPLYSTAFGDVNEVDMNDVRQGQIGDCFVMSAIASVAKNDPEAIKRMIRDNGDGTYTVTFKQRKMNFLGPVEYEDKQVTVKADFAKRAGQSGDYGEIWPLIIEKAYAQFKKEQMPQLGLLGPSPTDVYDPIANGGNPAEVIEALTGRPAEQWDTGLLGFASPFDNGYDRVKKEFDSGKNIILGSRDFNTTGFFAVPNPYGLVPKHAYTVQKIYTDNDGKRWVQLYNPWGSPESQPKPIPFDEVSNYFSKFTIC